MRRPASFYAGPATERLIAFEQRLVVLKYVILSHQLALPRLATSALNFDQADAFDLLLVPTLGVDGSPSSQPRVCWMLEQENPLN